MDGGGVFNYRAMYVGRGSSTSTGKSNFEQDNDNWFVSVAENNYEAII